MDGPKLSQIFLLWKKNTWWMVLLVSWTSFTLKFLTYNELYTIVQYCRLPNRYNFWLPMVILVVNFNFINISSNGILFMLMVTWAEITPDKYQNNEQNDNQMSVHIRQCTHFLLEKIKYNVENMSYTCYQRFLFAKYGYLEQGVSVTQKKLRLHLLCLLVSVYSFRFVIIT